MDHLNTTRLRIHTCDHMHRNNSTDKLKAASTNLNVKLGSIIRCIDSPWTPWDKVFPLRKKGKPRYRAPRSLLLGLSWRGVSNPHHWWPSLVGIYPSCILSHTWISFSLTMFFVNRITNKNTNNYVHEHCSTSSRGLKCPKKVCIYNNNNNNNNKVGQVSFGGIYIDANFWKFVHTL